jgi:hypothetical protein
MRFPCKTCNAPCGIRKARAGIVAGNDYFYDTAKMSDCLERLDRRVAKLEKLIHEAAERGIGLTYDGKRWLDKIVAESDRISRHKTRAAR